MLYVLLTIRRGSAVGTGSWGRPRWAVGRAVVRVGTCFETFVGESPQNRRAHSAGK